MSRQKSADDYYDDEYAKGQGKIDARRHAREREARAQRRIERSGGLGCGTVVGVGALLIGLLVGGVVLFAVLNGGGGKQPAATAGTPAAKPTGGNPPSDQPEPARPGGAGVVQPGTAVVLDGNGRQKGDTVGAPDGQRILLADTADNYFAYVNAVVGKKQSDAASMTRAGMAYYVPAGTRAVVLEQSKVMASDGAFGPVRVKIEDGPAAGRVGWCLWRMVGVAPPTALPAEPAKPAEPEPPPPNAVTITASKAAPVLIGLSRQHLADAAVPAKRTKHLASGELVELTGPTVVEMLYRAKDVTEVKWKGSGWVVGTANVPAAKR